MGIKVSRPRRAHPGGMARRAICALALLAACNLPDMGGEKKTTTTAAPCTNEINLAVAVEHTDSTRAIVATFNPDRFVSSYDWVRVPAGHEDEACWAYTAADRVKQVIIQAADPLAAKIAAGSVRYDVLPAPPQGVTYCWRSSTGKTACPESTDFADPTPALGAGNYIVVFYEPGFPHGHETGRAEFTLQ